MPNSLKLSSVGVELVGEVSVNTTLGTASVSGATIHLSVNGKNFCISIKDRDIPLWGDISNGRVTLNLGPQGVINQALGQVGVCEITNHGDRFRYVWKAVVRAVEAEISKNLT